jgi:hypothetical protein
MQKYGAYVVDVAGGDTAIRVQQNAFDATTMTALWHDMGQLGPLLEAVTPGSGSASSGAGAGTPTTPITSTAPTTPIASTAPTTPIASTAPTTPIASTAPTAPITSTSSTLPTLTIAASTLHVSAGGGTVDLGITETAPSSASSASITITGLPSYETITDGFGDTFSGSGRHGITITEAQVNSGLTLTSNYQGTQNPVATLQITANDTVAGVTSHSATQSLIVIDPPATSAATTGRLALLNQYIASGFDNHSGSAPLMSNVAAAFAHDSFLTSPRHA